MFPVRAKFWGKVGVGQYKISLGQYKTIEVYESPHKYSKTNMCVCVCVCVCLWPFI